MVHAIHRQLIEAIQYASILADDYIIKHANDAVFLD
jgi:hypothetical protein